MAREFPQNGYDQATGEWNDSLAGDFLWSNVNVSEAVPDVMTPATWSLWWIHHYEANPIQFPGGYRFCGNICGRAYLNLSLLISLYRAIGKDVREEMQGDMIGFAPGSLEPPLIPLSPLSVLWTVLPGLLKAQLAANQDQRQIPEYLATTPEWCRHMRRSIHATSDKAGLLALWREAIKPQFFQTCRMLRGVTMLFSDLATNLRLDLIRLAGEADANAMMSNLASAASFTQHAPAMESLGPLAGLEQVARGIMSREAYLERYGHRGPHEMELFIAGPDEDPQWLDQLLAKFQYSQADVESLSTRQHAAYTAAWQRFEASHPQKAPAFRRQLEKVAEAARQREAVRSEVTRVTRLIRRHLQRAGELTDLGDGIFFLALDEIAALLAGDESSIALIPLRREAYTRQKALPPYPAIVIGRFDPFRWVADPNRRTDYFDSRANAPTSPTTTITGFAGAAGRVEGTVRRVDRPEEGHLLQTGEILVTVTTNVGWTPLFPRAAAIITDVGAPLSHAAIVARELGIPAVVGCGNATMLLKTGDRVRVDGGRGIVEVMQKP